METRAKKQPDGDYILNGSKNWITNSPIADVMIVWARDDNNDIRGFILDRVRPPEPVSCIPWLDLTVCSPPPPPRSSGHAGH